MLTTNELLQKINAHMAGLHYSRPPKGLYDPIEYVLSIGGKRLRPLLMLMAYNLYRDDVESIFAPAAAIEIYHNYTLLHDDLMDRAGLRRGKPTVHKVWNDNTAILSGDAMLVLAYRYMSRCPGGQLPQVLDLFSRTALEICEGQQLDMEFERRMDVGADEYLEMIRLKTSALLACALEIGALLAKAPQADTDRLYDFGMNFGIAFQLKDDWLDVYGDPAVFGKNIGGDILCNKKTYLLIEALEHAAPAQRKALEQWLNAPAASFKPEEKIAAVTALYNQSGVKELCEQKIAVYSKLATESLAAVTVDAGRKQALRQLEESLMHRNV